MRRPAGIVVVLAIACACLFASSASAAPDPTVWLCKPGLAANPCKPGMDTTRTSPTGEILGVDTVQAARKPKADCFYVYPTVSDDQSPNSDLEIDPEERSIALYQAARYSLHCRVFAPMYRQLTLSAILGGSITEEQSQLAYGDVVSAWKNYLRRYNDGRGVILIGHSQGTYLLRQLVHDHVDGRKSVRKRLISALLLGGNVTVPEGGNVGGDFRHVPGCGKPGQLGCVVAFSTFNTPVPADARFGRPGNVIAPDLPATGDVLCTNPAALGGGSAPLRTVYPSEPFAPGTTIGGATEAVGIPRPAGVTTPWVQTDAYTGECSSADDADVLQILPVAGAPVLNPIPDQSWGLHLADANIALGNLTGLVKRQIKVYERESEAE